ncbi:MAG TPA: DUF2330 domain-containing protein, partial [Ktedonobacterales bacterium]
LLSLGSALLALALSVLISTPAAACGSLIAPNGAIRLERAATLVDWHGGVEHYMTAFSYQGDFDNIGWIVPLPTVPDKVEEGGGWTLQRLAREVAPPAPQVAFGALQDRAAPTAQVILQTRVRALDITVVKGSGDEIVQWATSNGFSIDAETKGHLLKYAQGTEIFLAAKFDTKAAKATNQHRGDGTPVLITMHLQHIWVPLEVLALEGQRVNADLYLLTDQPLYSSDLGAAARISPVGADLPGAPGLNVAFQEPMNASLYRDLSTDKNMGWVRANSWLTYLSLSAEEPQVTYDLGVASNGVMRIAPYGTAPMQVAERVTSRIATNDVMGVTLRVVLLMALVIPLTLGVFLLVRARRRARVTLSR